jgi:hypothetical protein
MVSWSVQPRTRRAVAGRATALFVALATLATFTAPVAAEITPEGQKVVDRHLAAIGGRAAFDAIETVHGRGTVQAFGLTGEVETWTARPDRRASRMALGPITMQQGHDGTKAWRTDPSGKVIVLDGLDLERSIASAWFDASRWLEHDQGGGKVSVASDVQEQGYDVLIVESPGGESRRMWVHRETGLIDRVVTKSDQRTVTNALSEYREFGGLRFATVARTSIEGMPANDVQITFETLEVNGDVANAPFAMPGDQGGAPQYLKTPGRAHLGFDYSGKHLWLRASVNGHPPADFIFDTGASITVIDSAYAASIGLEAQGNLQGQGAGATGSAALGSLETLRVEGADGDGVTLATVPIAVLSVNAALEPFFWRPCAGILGFNFINQFVTEIDYDTQTLVLHDPKTFEYAGKGEAIPMKLDGSVPTVTMTLDGKYEGEFRVDAGSSATVDLHRPFVAAHGIDKGVKRSVTVMSGGFGGTFTSRVTRMKSIQIGSYAWKQPVVSLSGAETGALASEDYAGNIGNRILERFRLTFDYERRVLWLEPGARFAGPDGFSRTGLQLIRVDDVVSIAQVVEDSPAAKAGLKAGDVVRTIDGRAAAEWNRAELETLFEEGKPGRKLTFELARDGRATRAVVTLREVI